MLKSYDDSEKHEVKLEYLRWRAYEWLIKERDAQYEKDKIDAWLMFEFYNQLLIEEKYRGK